MDTNALKKFAQEARTELLKTVNFKIDYALSDDSPARRETPKAVQELENRIQSTSRERVTEQVAYTWFNRFTALQYMDMNGYNRVRVIAPSDGRSRPEILSDASGGVFDDKFISENKKNMVIALLDGRSASNDPDNEAYRLLIVSVCNAWHSIMPFLFERIADYTELLMPDDLLSTTSILAKLREAMTPENCQDVEVIGWLYQFYISEKKDEVFAGLKKNQKVTSENIPAATQLFTPHWIVKYLVENSLGRLWMLNHPTSSLVKEMEYYIAPDEPETDFLKITSPEEIKVCDPACGSGHMLTYSFDLLYAIYEEAGYDAASIPTLILENNLYGIELDQRAGELSAFALTMKARGKHRTFFRNPVKPNICVLENIKFDPDELNEYMERIGRDLFTHALRTTLNQFEESDNFGSLIQPALEDVDEIRQTLRSKNLSENLFLKSTHDRVLKVIEQSDYLRQKYHVVVANPPYMGGNGMNGRLSVFAKDNFPDSKSDLFAMFMERIFQLIMKLGYSGMVTMQSWMFLSSYEKLRGKLLSNLSIVSMAHMENMVMGIAFGTSATVFTKFPDEQRLGAYCHIEYSDLGENNAPVKFPPANSRNSTSNSKNNLIWVTSNDFKKIPGSPIAYWVGRVTFEAFEKFQPISEFSTSSNGIQTGNNDKYVRFVHEISQLKFNEKWFLYNKGGTYRKWYGNIVNFVNWQNNGKEIKSERNHCARGEEFYFKPGITWSDVTSGNLSARKLPAGCLFDATGPSAFFKEDFIPETCLALMNSKLANQWAKILNPTLHFQSGDFRKLPFCISLASRNLIVVINNLISISKSDWDSYETSWDFTTLPLLFSDYRFKTLQNTYHALRAHWQGMTDEMLKLEEENNRIFIDAYGLQDELAPDVPIHEITLTCNPAYRYGQKIFKDVQEERLQQDTMKEFISYAVGCMFGRYALEEPGLILANHGETLEDYLQRIPNPSFMADDDNIIPVLDSEWFEDDVVGRFRKFLRVTFGEEHFEENRRFIETAIGKDLRKYFISDFYKDHVQTYKKRPIYWQFSSPKGSFNALIYMHRYNRDTVSILLNKYLREFMLKLKAEKTALGRIEISLSSTSGEKTQAIKETQKIDSILQELEIWEREVIFPLASKRIEIDLDDGVKTNYPKFGKSLTKVVGLS